MKIQGYLCFWNNVLEANVETYRERNKTQTQESEKEANVG